MSAEVQVYQQPRSHFEITQSPLAFCSKTLSGYEIGVEMRNWPREHKVSLNRGFFFHIFFYFGDKENRSIYCRLRYIGVR